MAGKTKGRRRPPARGNRKHRSGLIERAPSISDVRSGLASFLRRRKKLVLAGFLGISTLTAVAFGVYWLGTSPRFGVAKVEASGQKWLSNASLESRLQLAERTNLFHYDTDAARERLEASAWVKEAQVRRVFPNGLAVELIENEPAALALLGQLYLVDSDGVPFKQASTREAATLGLPVVTGISRDQYRRAPNEASRLIAQAIALAATWSEVEERFEIAEINIDAIRGFSLIPERGHPAIRLGDGKPSELRARLSLFDQAWSSLTPIERDDAGFVHLDTAPAPSRVAIAFRSDSLEREKKQQPWAN